MWAGPASCKDAVAWVERRVETLVWEDGGTQRRMQHVDEMSIGDNGELAVDGSAPARRGLGRCWMLADAGVAGMDGRSAVRRRGLIQP